MSITVASLLAEKQELKYELEDLNERKLTIQRKLSVLERTIAIYAEGEIDDAEVTVLAGEECSECGKVCKNRTGLGVHLSRIHGLRLVS
jgi:DNA repair exonuclease SbcCD ATPase subunit